MGVAALSTTVLIRKRPSFAMSNCLPPVFTSNPPPAIRVWNSAAGMPGWSVFPVVETPWRFRIDQNREWTACCRSVCSR
jgi:hypothetical protein